MLPLRSALLTAALVLLPSCNYDARLAGIESNQVGLEKRLEKIEGAVGRQNGDLASLQQQIKDTNNDLHMTAALLKQTRNEVSGVGNRSVTVPGTGDFWAVFGNSSGHNATVYVTNASYDALQAASLQIFVRRIKKPAPTHSEPAPIIVVPNPLPLEFEATEKFDLAANGASRTLVVPCGFELLAGNAAVPTKLDILIYYQEAPCQ